MCSAISLRVSKSNRQQRVMNPGMRLDHHNVGNEGCSIRNGTTSSSCCDALDLQPSNWDKFYLKRDISTRTLQETLSHNCQPGAKTADQSERCRVKNRCQVLSVPERSRRAWMIVVSRPTERLNWHIPSVFRTSGCDCIQVSLSAEVTSARRTRSVIADGQCGITAAHDRIQNAKTSNNLLHKHFSDSTAGHRRQQHGNLSLHEPLQDTRGDWIHLNLIVCTNTRPGVLPSVLPRLLQL